MENQLRKKLIAQGNPLKANIQVGKSGVTDQLKAELLAQLKRDNLVKIKILESGQDHGSVEELAKSISESINCHLVEVRGGTALFYKGKLN